ncbi:MAG TPA: OmpA family protein [Phycisphaerae bacterium]|nr:OmpA family protein [Phycisphaerae bacterium]
MTRMLRTTLIPFTALFALAIATGCGPDAKTKKIEDLTAENDSLKKDLEGKDRELQEAQMREGDAKSTIDQLNQKLASMRGQGATVKKDGEWTSFDNFDLMTVQGSVLFDSGKADLTGGGKSKLQQIASEIRSRFPDRDIYVFGHTDDQPIKRSKWKDNWELGAHRALTVVRALHDSGVPYESLVQANCGQYRPKISNSGGDKNRSQNRRVEFYAVKKKGGIAETTTITSSKKPLKNNTPVEGE